MWNLIFFLLRTNLCKITQTVSVNKSDTIESPSLNLQLEDTDDAPSFSGPGATSSPFPTPDVEKEAKKKRKRLIIESDSDEEDEPLTRSMSEGIPDKTPKPGTIHNWI